MGLIVIYYDGHGLIAKEQKHQMLIIITVLYSYDFSH